MHHGAPPGKVFCNIKPCLSLHQATATISTGKRCQRWAKSLIHLTRNPNKKRIIRYRR